MIETLVLRESAMLKVRPELIDEWDFEKNDELGLNIYDMTRGASTEAWWICKKNKKHKWQATVSNRSKGTGCPICINKQILIGYNDMWTTNPELASMLLNPDDGYKYTQTSNQKVDWKCPDCGEPILQKYINNTKKTGLSCPVCSDGVSFPEKFVYHILKENGVSFEFEKKFNWNKDKKYDFYIESLGCIIETHGEQHTTGKFKGVRMRDEKGNDKSKKETAFKNGIKHYIEIDACISTGDYISNSILSLDSPLKHILISDFKLTEERARGSFMKNAWELWNDGLGVNEIAEKMVLCRPTIRKYLKIGASLNKCDYTTEKSKKRGRELDSKARGTKVLQFDKDMSFIREWETVKEVIDYFSSIGLKSNSSSIHACCQGRNKTALGYKWKYAEQYKIEKRGNENV